MPLASGTQLGPYEVVEPIGAGGMGEVYRARDLRLDRSVAIKILAAHISSRPDAIQRFEREARTVAALNHPNICALYDIGEAAGARYLVMEYLEGETLAKRLETGPLPLDAALNLGIQIADVIDKAHRDSAPAAYRVHYTLPNGSSQLSSLLAVVPKEHAARSLVDTRRDQQALAEDTMKRRQFLSAVVAAPVAATVTGRRVDARQRGAGAAGAPAAPQAPPALVPVPTASLSEPATAPLAPTFFTAEQFAALQKAADLFVPPSGGNPGARDAGAPEFLDFYIGISAADRQALYRQGLDDLNARARRRYRAPFGQLDDGQASAVLKPLFAPYAGKRSSLAYGPFVNEMRADLRVATTNSPAWAAAARAAGRPVPSGQYWRISHAHHPSSEVTSMAARAKVYDVLIVGSGHSGGMAAYILAQKGLSCLMLNAGPVVDVNKDRPITPASELPYRGFRRPGALTDGPLDEYRLSAFVHPDEVPYTTDPDKPFVWVRNRVVGSRSIFWSRQSFRLSDFEFKQKDFEGGVDQNWPVNLAEMAPSYERVEEIFRISGHPEGLPQFPDPKFAVVTAKPQPASQVMQRFWDATGKRNIRISVSRSSMGINNLASSVNLLLPDAFASGNLTLVPDAVVRELSVNKATGLVDGVHYVERLTRREMQAKARVVVLAAGSLESVRLLLNSGLANSSGLLGHYIFDQMYADVVQGFVPEALEGKGPGIAGGGGFLPPFRNVGGTTKARDFTGRYSLSVTSGGTPSDDVLGTFGDELQQQRAHYSGAGFSASMMGAVLPRKENHVRIDAKVTDAWGIPVLHISAAYGDNERRMQTDAQDRMAELMKECGVELLMKTYARREFGQSVHELGGCRMGDDPKTSVLNRWNQTHDIKNLLVVDGSSFVTGGWQNPTMTISAVAMRASEHLAEEMRKANL